MRREGVGLRENCARSPESGGRAGSLYQRILRGSAKHFLRRGVPALVSSAESSQCSGGWPGAASSNCLNAFLCLALVSPTPGRWSPAESIEPQEEPRAGNLHARICEGKSRMAALLDHSLFRLPALLCPRTVCNA